MRRVFFISCLLLSACIPLDSEQIYADYIVDGDTFVTESGTTVRIWGIDAPEKNKPFYSTATLTLENIIEDIALDCNFMAKGKYRRDVMRCYAGDADIGAIMVSQGMAKDYESVSGGYYLPDEIAAQKAKRGIWRE